MIEYLTEMLGPVGIEHLMWIVTAASIVGTVANIHKRRWCFIVWSFTNASWTIYDIYKEAYSQAALMGVYFFLALWGIHKWREAVEVKEEDAAKEEAEVQDAES